MGKKLLWAALLIVVVGGLAVMNYLRLGFTLTAATVPAETGIITESVFANGRLAPKAERTVFTDRSGKVAVVHVEEGDEVQAGDLLITYDTEEWERQLEEARSQVETAKLQREIERKQHFEQIRGQTDAEEADKVRQAEEQAQRLYELQVAAHQRTIAQLTEQIRDNALTAPVSGVVTMVSVQEGAVVPAGTEAVQIVDLSGLVVEAALNELDAGKVDLGMEAIVTGDAFEEQFSGKLVSIAPTAVPAGAEGYDYEVPVKVELEGGVAVSNRLKPGFAVTLEFVLSGEERVLVPIGAVKYSGSEAYVFTAADGVAVKLPVTVGKDDGERIEILSGLEAGEAVIYPVPDGLHEGDEVATEAEA